MKHLVLTVVLGWMMSANAAHATSDFAGHGSAATPITKATYIVSGILRKTSDRNTIKLVHAVKVASSPAEAVSIMISEASVKFPDFAVLDSLATPLATPQEVPSGRTRVDTWI